MGSKKSDSVAVMQEFFPNGGQDWDLVCGLYDAIKDGKVPFIKGIESCDLEQTISKLQHYLKENYHPHTELVITESSYDIKVSTFHSNLSVYDDE